MTKRELDTFQEAVCPCGKGHILRHVASTDYRHTSVHISYSIGCTECNRIWRLEHGTLVLRGSETTYVAAKVESDLARNKLHEFAQSLVKSYCERMVFKSKKAELEHLLSLGICQAKYASYIKDRRTGKAMHEMAYGLRNISWLTALAEAVGKRDVLAELLRAHEVLSAKTEAASTQIVRRGLKGASAS
jgi:hypothetical protein